MVKKKELTLEDKKLFIDDIMKPQLDSIKDKVCNKDRDFVLVIDGEEGCGKSVLAMQFAKYFDPNLTMENITFDADQFMERLRNAEKNSCIVLDEAFNAANSRAAMTEVNRSMIGVATEMRQRNLFIIMVLPTFFDLDKYFALWRCRALIHVYYNKTGDRGNYIIFPKSAKKYLYLTGRKQYNYSKPKSPYPPCRFFNYYPLDEEEYRKKKASAFKKRKVTRQEKRWIAQRNILVRGMVNDGYKLPQIREMFKREGKKCFSSRTYQRILNFVEIPEADES